MLITLFAPGWAASPQPLAVAAGVTLGFAVLARTLRGVTQSGALAGGIACFTLFACAGPGAFAALATLFLMTWLTTRLGYTRKQELGLAERREGRNATQVLANLAIAAIGALLFATTGNHVWTLAAIAALAEAATDTVASEVGQSGRQNSRLISTGQPVPAGTDGGVTLRGTLAGLFAGIAIAVVAALAGIVSRNQIWIPVASGFAGMLADSLLGATLQRRGWISNEAVNLLGTLGAAALACIICN
jgi:uncharacterized protein (TIGR00297 family)